MASPIASEITRPTRWDALVPACTLAMTIVAAIAVGPTIGLPLLASVLLLIVFFTIGLRDALRWHAVAVYASQHAAALEASLVAGDDA